MPTADERVLPGGTAYITDVGMTGPTDSVIGVEKDLAIAAFLTADAQPLRDRQGPAQLQGVVVEIDPGRGQALPSSGSRSWTIRAVTQ